MYRLTICQTDMNYPYIVYDNETLDGIQKALESYRKDYDTSKFISYDLIKFDEFLEESSTLEDVSFKELRKEGYV